MQIGGFVQSPHHFALRALPARQSGWTCGMPLLHLRLDDEDKRVVPIIDSLGRTQQITVINESGLYALLFAMQPQKANNDGESDNPFCKIMRKGNENISRCPISK